MLAHYITLGLPPTATNQEIREQYLRLMRAHPPSREPEVSQRIVEAFEAIQGDRKRIYSNMFGVFEFKDHNKAIDKLISSCSEARRNPNLQMIIRAEGIADD